MSRIDYTEGEIVGNCIFINETDGISYGRGGVRRSAQFKCCCGVLFISVIDSVKRGKTRSCGCVNTVSRIAICKAKKTHGLSRTPLYVCWVRIKQRCTNKNSKDYPLYGERGITVCDRWSNSFENFHTDMQPTYVKGLELERLNPNLGYSPENCVWATESTQAWNQRKPKNNTTGRTGVSRASRARKDGSIPYTAAISKDGKEYFLGTFDTFEQAVKVREAAEIKFYGDIHPYK